MENKINIAELLKDCPKGMELYSPIFGEVYLDEIRPHLAIVVTTDKEQGDFKEEFLYDGRYGMNGECMLFPSKGKTTWEGFVPPVKFKVGDVVISTSNNIHLISCRDKNNGWESCCSIIYGKFDSTKTVHVIPTRFATEEEKQKLFDAIKANGYRWNSETKTLEKLPKFKAGDRIKVIYKKGFQYDIIELTDAHYILEEVENKFKYVAPISADENWKLVPSKFDISSLKPFDKVLVRSDNKHRWSIQFFERLNNVLKDAFVCMRGERYHQCIPFKGNEHLLNTANDCEDYFKTWQKS